MEGSGQTKSGIAPVLGVAEVADQLAAAIRAVMDALPQGKDGPTAVGRALGLNRVPISRLLGAIRRESGTDILASLPGPETLRSIVLAAAREGVDPRLVERAIAAVDEFETMIRSYGTRAAFDAAMSVQEPETLERFEQAARYQVFRGMSQVLGVEAEMWLSTMVMSPSKGSDTALDVTAVHGGLGMRRLRPDVSVSFTYGAPHEAVGMPGGSSDLALDLSPYYTQAPAPLKTHNRNGNVVHEFSPELMGKEALYDMLAGAHAPNHSKRYSDEKRSTRGVVVIPDIPVALMVVDLFVEKGVFPGLDPTVYLYNTTARGPADIENPSRLHDRVVPPVGLEKLQLTPGTVSMDRLSGYWHMLRDVFRRIGQDPSDFRGWRLRVPYPLYGFQWVLAFNAPAPPPNPDPINEPVCPPGSPVG